MHFSCNREGQWYACVKNGILEGKTLSELSKLCLSTRLGGMLDGKNFERIVVVFPFLAAFNDRVTCYDHAVTVAVTHTTRKKFVARRMKECSKAATNLKKL